MKSNHKEKTSDTDSTNFKVTAQHAKMLQSLVYNLQKIKLEQEAYSDDVKAIADKMGLKPGQVKEMVSWMIQEQNKGGVLSDKEQKLELVRQVISFIDTDSEESSE